MYVPSLRKSLAVLICAAASRCLISGDLYGQISNEQSSATQNQSHGQDPSQTQTQDLSLAAHSEIRSKLFHLKPGSGFAVTGTSGSNRFLADFYVYDADKVLVAREDPAAVALSFQWHAGREGDYYVLGRNLSDESGTIHVAVVAGGVRMGGPRGLRSNTTTANYAVVRVFYATDRGVNGKNNQGPGFGGEPDANGQMHYGEVSVSIPRDHRMGELEGPSIWLLQFKQDPKRDVVLQTVEGEDQAGFLKGISDRIAHSQKKEILVFVHGFNTTFEDASRRTAQIAYDMAYDGPTILYSWPSQGSISPIAYNKDGRNAQLTVPHLEEFLKMLLANSHATTIDVIAHSMGNRPVTQALRDFALENRGQKNKPMFNQVALMAPDVDAALFQQMAHDMELSAHRITLYASSRDAALRLSNYFAGYQRAGEGLPHLLVVPGLDTVDASAVDTSMLGFYHSYFADSTTILSDLFRNFTGVPPSSRQGLHAVATAAGKYWRFGQ
jgi:esterase/lipase superfamily enzyme